MREPGASAPLDERDPRRPHPCPPSCRDVMRSGGKLGFLGLPEILERSVGSGTDRLES